jgi:hypothetical protein
MGFAVSVLLMAATASASEVGSAPNFCAPALTTSSLTAPKIGEARCDQPDCARRHLDARASVRLTGEFGMFTGRVARWSADSLTGFSADPDWGGVPPPAPLGWVQVQRVDQRVSNTATGAVIGALTLGALGALVAVTGETSTAAFTVFSGKQPDYGQAALKGGAIGALIGAALGAAMGSTSNRWVPIYQRP